MSAEVLDLVKQTSADITARLQKMEEKYNTSITNLDARQKSLEEVFKDKLIRQTGSVHKPLPANQWSWARYCFAIAAKDWSYAPFERAECEAYRADIQKTMAANAFGLGGSLIPEQYINELIDVLRPTLISQALGARVMSGLTGSPVKIGKKTNKSSLTWVNENAGPTAQDLTTGLVQLNPHKGMIIIKLSNDLIMLANPAMEALVRADLATGIAEGLDLAFFRGSGVWPEPTGIFNSTPAIPAATVVWQTDGPTKLAAMKNVVKTLAANEGLSGSLGWAMNVNSYFAIDGLNDGQGRPYLQPDVAQPGKMTFLGYPIYFSTQVSATSTDRVIFGNWSDAILGLWGTVGITASDTASTAFENDQLWVKAIIHADCAVRREKSFALSQGAVN